MAPHVTPNADVPVVVVPFGWHEHLGQVYTGFQMLEAQGLVKVRWKRRPAHAASSAILTVHIVGGPDVTYDLLDGLNWIPGDRVSNLGYFADNAPPGVYFKRSYDSSLIHYAPAQTKVHPLGLNYFLEPNIDHHTWSGREIARHAVRSTALTRSLLRVQGGNVRERDLRPSLGLTGDPRILLYTRLWDPSTFGDALQPGECERINDARIAAVEMCRQRYGGLATVGIREDVFSKTRVTPDLLIPWSHTNKAAYLKLVKSHSICVATTGLHGSIGWRFGEYIACARGVISEPLNYVVGSTFREGHNYLSFTSAEHLVERVDELLGDRMRLLKMMLANRSYYLSTLRPDQLVLRTLAIAQGVHID